MLKTLQIYTTTPGPQNSTEPWVPPPWYIDYEALLEIQATITNVSSLEERNQIKDLIWTDQSVLNNTAMLEEFDVQALEVPKGLYISVQPAEANGMV